MIFRIISYLSHNILCDDRYDHDEISSCIAVTIVSDREATRINVHKLNVTNWKSNSPTISSVFTLHLLNTRSPSISSLSENIIKHLHPMTKLFLPGFPFSFSIRDKRFRFGILRSSLMAMYPSLSLCIYWEMCTMHSASLSELPIFFQKIGKMSPKKW